MIYKAKPINHDKTSFNSDGSVGILIEKDEYLIIEEYASKMWANQKKGEWGRGLVNTPEDPFKVERTGRLGELALAKLLGLSLDLSYIKGGDAQDFIIGDMKYDIKTATKLPVYRAGLIKAYYHSKSRIPLKCDRYVFAYILSDDIINKEAGVVLVGYIDKYNISDVYLKVAKKGSHYNYEIPYKNLKPISYKKDNNV